MKHAVAELFGGGPQDGQLRQVDLDDEGMPPAVLESIGAGAHVAVMHRYERVGYLEQERRWRYEWAMPVA